MSDYLDLETIYNQLIEFDFTLLEDRELYFSLITKLTESEKKVLKQITNLIVSGESDSVIKNIIFELFHAD